MVTGVKSALGNAPALATDTFDPEENQVEFRLCREPAGQVLVFVNGLLLRRGAHFSVSGRTIALEIDYSLGAGDTVDISYEVIA